MTDLPEGVTSKTTKAQLIQLLRDARDRLHIQQDQQLDELQTMEEDLRSRWHGRFDHDKDPYHQVLVLATRDEWIDAVEFLSDLEDILPPALRRIQQGGKIMFIDETGQGTT